MIADFSLFAQMVSIAALHSLKNERRSKLSIPATLPQTRRSLRGGY